MGPALTSVTNLIINTKLYPAAQPTNPEIMWLTTIASSKLAALAKACPALRSLQLEGDIGLEALSALGALCPHIIDVSVSSLSIPCNILHNLYTILPSLLHFRVTAFDCDLEDESDTAFLEAYSRDAAHALSSCSRLRSLDLPHLHISEASTWGYFPPKLWKLTMGVCSVPPHLGVTLPALTELSLGRARPHSMGNVRTISGILLAAPQLMSMRTIIHSSCEEGDLEAISILHNRCQAGLFTTPLFFKKDSQAIGGFLHPFPTLPGIHTLFFTGVEFPDDSIKDLARVFPNLENLSLIGPELMDDSVGLLSGLTGLQSLSILLCHGMTDIGVLICMQLPSLILLEMSASAGISGIEVLQAQARPGLEVVLKPWPREGV